MFLDPSETSEGIFDTLRSTAAAAPAASYGGYANGSAPTAAESARVVSERLTFSVAAITPDCLATCENGEDLTEDDCEENDDDDSLFRHCPATMTRSRVRDDDGGEKTTIAIWKQRRRRRQQRD